jgi:hypothetical protein
MSAREAVACPGMATIRYSYLHSLETVATLASKSTLGIEITFELFINVTCCVYLGMVYKGGNILPVD